MLSEKNVVWESPVAGTASTLLEFMLSWPVLFSLTIISVVGAAPYMPLFDLDEGAFSEATREMLASGNWVSTYLNGEPRHDKPILIYWFQATIVQIFGVHPFSFRIPSMIAAVGWLFVVYRFCRVYFNENSARVAIWIFTCSWLATIIFKSAIADALLNWILCLIMFDIYRYIDSGNKRRLLLIGFYMGLGFLTKGPIAVILPIGVFLIALSIFGRFNEWLGAVFHPYSWGVFVLTILPWHIAVYFDQGWGFFEGFYLGHNIGRFSDTMESHGGSIFYYLILLPFLVAPYTRQFFLSLGQLRQLKSNFLVTFLWVWFLLTLLIFSFSKTQLPHYLLYGLSAVFILLAGRLGDADSGNRCINLYDHLLALAFVLIFVVTPFFLPEISANTNRSYDAAILALAGEVFYGGYYLPLLVLGGVAVGIVFARKIDPLSKLMGLGLCITLIFNFVWGPLVAKAQQTPVLEAARYIEDIERPVVAYRIGMPSFSVYMNRIVPEVEPTPGDIVFTRVDRVKELREKSGGNAQILYQKGGIVLLNFNELATVEN